MKKQTIKTQTYITLLRGINVGGHRKIGMNDLRELFAEQGCKNISTYIQSGNVVFDHDEIPPETLAAQIERSILKKFGFDVYVLIRTRNELADALINNPFLRENNPDPAHLHVTFLAEEPAQSDAEEAGKYRYDPDRFILSGKEVFVHCPGGYGKTKLNNSFFEKKLKTEATTRNWNTVNILVEMMQRVEP